jgi:hypothetical protein
MSNDKKMGFFAINKRLTGDFAFMMNRADMGRNSNKCVDLHITTVMLFGKTAT